MKKWVCTVCGYVYEGENAPEKCPQCGVPASKFKEQESDKMAWACEHEVGVAQGSPEDIMMDLRANFEGECSEVGMYLAMSRVAHREGYPEIGMYWAKAAYEEADGFLSSHDSYMYAQVDKDLGIEIPISGEMNFSFTNVANLDVVVRCV